MVQINIEKKHLYFLSLLVVLVGGVLVYGQGSIPNPGHSAEDISISIDDETKNLGSFVNNKLCRKDGTNCALGEIKLMVVKIHDELLDVNLKTIHKYAKACSGGGSPNGMCCQTATRQYCKQEGYKLSILVASCGEGWCKGNDDCKHQFYCIK